MIKNDYSTVCYFHVPLFHLRSSHFTRNHPLKSQK